MDTWKAEVGRVREEKRREEKKKEDQKWESLRREKIQVREKVFIQWFEARLKRRGAEPAGQMRDEKLHAVVARGTFPSQNVQGTPGSDHFWKLRCRTSAHRCGAKHISKSKF